MGFEGLVSQDGYVPMGLVPWLSAPSRNLPPYFFSVLASRVSWVGSGSDKASPTPDWNGITERLSREPHTNLC